jgi:hypothetical protein
MAMVPFRYFFLIVVLCLCNSTYSIIFIYPIAAFRQNGKIFFCYACQKSLQNLELIVCSDALKYVGHVCDASYNCAGACVSPDEAKIAFIDQGRIRICVLCTNVVFSLDFNQPLYCINSVCWQNNESCYFCAKQYGFYGVFEVDMSGNISTILANSQADYLYPQKVDTQLFAIKRIRIKSGYRYQVIQCPFRKAENIQQDIVDIFFGQEGSVEISTIGDTETIVGEKSEVVIVHCGSQIALSLSMIDQACGFFVRPVPVTANSTTTSFSCYLFYNAHGKWCMKEAFQFSVPSLFLFGSTRLHESILPFIPRYFDGGLYYASAHETSNLALYVYQLSTDKISTVYATDKDHCFAPFVCGEKILHGSIAISEKNSHRSIPTWKFIVKKY